MPFINSLAGGALGAAGGSNGGSGGTAPSMSLKDMKLVCLWKNAAPTSSFGSSLQQQTKVSLNLSGYSAVMIEYLTSTGNTLTRQTAWGIKDTYLQLPFTEGSTANYGARRCKIESDGITFEPAYNHTSTKAYNYAIPTAIYGAFRVSTYEVATFNKATVELQTSGWTTANGGFTQTVEVEGIDSNSIVIVAPVPDSHDAYVSASVYACAQSDNSITFRAATTPSDNLAVSIVWPV